MYSMGVGSAWELGNRKKLWFYDTDELINMGIYHSSKLFLILDITYSSTLFRYESLAVGNRCDLKKTYSILY